VKIQGFVTRTGARKTFKDGKESVFPWINLEGMFLNMGFGVAVPDQNREISATCTMSSYKVTPKPGDAPKGRPGTPGAPESAAKAEYRNNTTIVGWQYIGVGA
jgi:hypothetical protein